MSTKASGTSPVPTGANSHLPSVVNGVRFATNATPKVARPSLSEIERIQILKEHSLKEIIELLYAEAYGDAAMEQIRK